MMRKRTIDITVTDIEKGGRGFKRCPIAVRLTLMGYQDASCGRTLVAVGVNAKRTYHKLPPIVGRWVAKYDDWRHDGGPRPGPISFDLALPDPR